MEELEIDETNKRDTAFHVLSQRIDNWCAPGRCGKGSDRAQNQTGAELDVNMGR